MFVCVVSLSHSSSGVIISGFVMLHVKCLCIVPLSQPSSRDVITPGTFMSLDTDFFSLRIFSRGDDNSSRVN